LALDRVSISPDASIVTCSPLGLVPKADGGFRRIHNLSWPQGLSVNDAIPDEYAALQYASIDQVLSLVRAAGPGAILLKRDIKDAFRMVPIALAHQRFLGFCWQGIVYNEKVLPFGLRTAPFLFNLFAEALHWILATKTSSGLVHYLDDFVFVLLPSTDPSIVAAIYSAVTDDLGIPRNESKNACGCKVDVLGYTIDTQLFYISLPTRKQYDLIKMIETFVRNERVSRKRCENLAGSLG
jgi:hypothetical protein